MVSGTANIVETPVFRIVKGKVWSNLTCINVQMTEDDIGELVSYQLPTPLLEKVHIMFWKL